MGALIGISGKAFSGKDTFADMLTAVAMVEFGVVEGKIKRLSFAGLLKKIAKENFGLTHEQITIPELKETVDERWGMTPRKILQGLGAGYRNIYENYWVDSVLNQYNPDNDELFFITDVRYLNEANLIAKRGGNLVRVERPAEHRPPVTDPNHPSEIELDDYPFFTQVVYNDKKIGDLKWAARELLSKLGYSQEDNLKWQEAARVLQT